MTSRMQTSPFIALRWLAGPIVWAAHLLTVYASESLLCGSGGGAAAHGLLTLTATVAALALLLMTIAYGGYKIRTPVLPGAAFMETAGLGLALLALLGVAWTGAAAAILLPCTP